MNTLTLQILSIALERVRHGWPTFDGALKYRTTADATSWAEVDTLLFTARTAHDGGLDDVPALPRASKAPGVEHPQVVPHFFRWRAALVDAHACVKSGLPWEDAPGGGGLTRPQAITVLSFALLLSQNGAVGLKVAPGEVSARAALPAKRLQQSSGPPPSRPRPLRDFLPYEDPEE